MIRFQDLPNIKTGGPEPVRFSDDAAFWFEVAVFVGAILALWAIS